MLAILTNAVATLSHYTPLVVVLLAGAAVLAWLEYVVQREQDASE